VIGITIGVSVDCVDGPGGTCTHLIVRSLKVTRVVVKLFRSPYVPAERSVPFDQIIASAPGMIWLTCTRNELNAMESYYAQAYVGAGHAGPMLSGDSLTSEPYGFLEQHAEGFYGPRLRSDEHTLELGLSVEATDGTVGTVQELLLESSSGVVAHVLVRHRHSGIAVPAWAVDFAARNTLYLNVDREALTRFPTAPMGRHASWKPTRGELIERVSRALEARIP
jgi:hypothetical protein